MRNWHWPLFFEGWESWDLPPIQHLPCGYGDEGHLAVIVIWYKILVIRAEIYYQPTLELVLGTGHSLSIAIVARLEDLAAL